MTKAQKPCEDLKKAFKSSLQPRGMTFITGIVRSCELRKIPYLSFIMKKGANTGDQKQKKDQGYLTELFSEKGKQAYMKNRQEPPKPPSPMRTVNVISGGEDIHGVTYTATNKVSKVTITHGKRVRQVLENESISFDDADTEGVMTPHNDALVISLLVYDTNVKRVLIDPGSSVNIILLRVLREMQAKDKMIPKAHTLSGFDNSSVVTKGEVILTTFATGVVKETKFQVVDMEMAYNMIMGRPWIHDMDTVSSTLHQVIKFPSPWGICQIRGDQQRARSINAVTDTSTVNKEK
ncbi:uncharacterized protein [Nicotiana sylvestris]|uniref:uncharacterized protein n=1 Tax=Nicotiana sylvestris TaxID=4096 RepID=UPI00388CC122